MYALKMVQFLILLGAAAEAAPSSWVKQVESKLISGCKGIRLKDYKKEFQSLQALLGQESWNDEVIQVAKVLYPHRLPKSVPVNGIYLVCYEDIKQFVNSKNPSDFEVSRQALKSCEQGESSTDESPIRKKWLQCLDQIRF